MSEAERLEEMIQALVGIGMQREDVERILWNVLYRDHAVHDG